MGVSDVIICIMLGFILNNFRRSRLRYESNPLRDILFQTFRQYSGSWLKLKKPHSKNFSWKYIKKEHPKSYIGSKEQKAVFPVVVFQTDANFVIAHDVFACSIGCPSKVSRQKNQASCIKFSSPETMQIKQQRRVFKRFIRMIYGYTFTCICECKPGFCSQRQKI